MAALPSRAGRDRALTPSGGQPTVGYVSRGSGRTVAECLPDTTDRVLAADTLVDAVAAAGAATGVDLDLGAGYGFGFGFGTSDDDGFDCVWIPAPALGAPALGAAAGPPPGAAGVALLVGRTSQASGVVRWA